MGKRMSSTGETEGRRWLNTVIPAPDGYSDPTDAVKIRAVKVLEVLPIFIISLCWKRKLQQSIVLRSGPSWNRLPCYISSR